MSVTVIPQVLDVDYQRGSDLRTSARTVRWISPTGRWFMKPVTVGRYLSGTIDYIFQLDGGAKEARWNTYKALVDVCIQNAIACLFVDRLEFRFVNIDIGTWDGTTFDFQLFIEEAASGYTAGRKVTRPIHNWDGSTGKPPRLAIDGLLDPTDGLPGLENTVQISIGATVDTASPETAFTVAETTGVVSFDHGLTHTVGHHIFASFYCAWPVGFDDPEIPGDLNGPVKRVKAQRIREIAQDA